MEIISNYWWLWLWLWLWSTRNLLALDLWKTVLPTIVQNATLLALRTSGVSNEKHPMEAVHYPRGIIGTVRNRLFASMRSRAGRATGRNKYLSPDTFDSLVWVSTTVLLVLAAFF